MFTPPKTITATAQVTHTMNICFYLSRKRKNRKGLCPIYGRVSGNTKSKDFGTGIFIEEALWGQGWPVSNVRECVNRLSNIANQIYGHIAAAERRMSFCPADVVRAYKNVPTSDSIIEIAQELVSTERPSVGSSDKIIIATKQFVELTGCASITEVIPETLKGYVNRMKEVNLATGKPKFADTTIQKKLEFFKRVFVYAENKEYIRRNPFRFYKVPKAPDTEPLHLTTAEQTLLHNHRFASNRLQYVCNLYLFVCNSGLSYGDLFLFNRGSIVTELDQRQFITGKRAKPPHEEYYLPYMPLAKALAEQYSYQFKHISNQKYNAYIKECAQIVGIEKEITTHTARATFAQNMLDVGYSQEAVAKMMGHKTFKMTRKHYARLSQKRVQLESLKLVG